MVVEIQGVGWGAVVVEREEEEEGGERRRERVYWVCRLMEERILSNVPLVAVFSACI